MTEQESISDMFKTAINNIVNSPLDDNNNNQEETNRVNILKQQEEDLNRQRYQLQQQYNLQQQQNANYFDNSPFDFESISSKLDSMLNDKDNGNSFSYKYYFIFGGIIGLLFLLNKASITKKQQYEYY